MFDHDTRKQSAQIRQNAACSIEKGGQEPFSETTKPETGYWPDGEIGPVFRRSKGGVHSCFPRDTLCGAKLGCLAAARISQVGIVWVFGWCLSSLPYLACLLKYSTSVFRDLEKRFIIPGQLSKNCTSFSTDSSPFEAPLQEVGTAGILLLTVSGCSGSEKPLKQTNVFFG